MLLKHPYPALILSWIYWIYLAMTSSMVVVHDAISYEHLGTMLNSDGWVKYFLTGPNREPVYPFLISLSMCAADFLNTGYQKVLVWMQILILFTTQLLTLRILEKFQVNKLITTLTILYLGLSPALVNSGFSLFSEIATYPTILAIILLTSHCYDYLKENDKLPHFLHPLLLGALFTIITLTKAIFSVIVPMLLLPFLFLLFKMGLQKNFKGAVRVFSFLVIVTMVFTSGVDMYKLLNFKYNSNFAITGRGPWALYGNTKRRMEPLTVKKVLVALAYIPGEGVCHKIFSTRDCDYWSFKKSDEFGYGKLHELTGQGLSGSVLDDEMLKLSKELILKNPFQFALFMDFEMGKMIFWESTKIGFVDYPPLLTKLFGMTIFKNGLRLLLFLLTFVALLGQLASALRNQDLIQENRGLLMFILILIFSYLGVHSLFFTLTRYSLPIAPLFLILIALFAQERLNYFNK